MTHRQYNKCASCQNTARLNEPYCGRCAEFHDQERRRLDAWDDAEKCVAATNGAFTEQQSEALREMINHLRIALS